MSLRDIVGRIAIGRIAIGTMALAACVIAAPLAAQPFDDSKYPAFEGQWFRVGPLAVFDTSKPPGRGQEAPLTPEYQAIFEANLADVATGGFGDDPVFRCIPEGMPRAMTLVLPMEIVVKRDTTYMLMEYLGMIRRIYTDGRDFPTDQEPTWMGTSIGKWIDEDGDGRYDALEIETRNLKNPRTFDPSGLPLHKDAQTVIKERLYLDKAKPDTLYDEITTYDHALTRPWTVVRTMRRDHHPVAMEYVCEEGNVHVKIGNETYMLNGDNLLMPAKKGQAPPDLRFFKEGNK
jgi:hypothetical protein